MYAANSLAANRRCTTTTATKLSGFNLDEVDVKQIEAYRVWVRCKCPLSSATD